MQLLTLDDFWDNQIILPAGLSDRNRPNDSLQYSSIMLTILVCWAAGPACLRNNCLVLMSSHFGFLVGICLEQFWDSTPALFEIDVWQAQVLTRTPCNVFGAVPGAVFEKKPEAWKAQVFARNLCTVFALWQMQFWEAARALLQWTWDSDRRKWSQETSALFWKKYATSRSVLPSSFQVTKNICSELVF
jgi:hypothetical protein